MTIPWTVATYMVEGGGSKDHAATRLWAYRDPIGFQQLMDILVESSIDYLSMQRAWVHMSDAPRPCPLALVGRLKAFGDGWAF